MSKVFSTDFAGRPISLKADYVAGQADGAILASYGETVVLVTAVSLKTIREGVDFLPLTVDYQEMTYAAGKIPGGFSNGRGALTRRRCSPRGSSTVRSAPSSRNITSTRPSSWRRSFPWTMRTIPT